MNDPRQLIRELWYQFPGEGVHTWGKCSNESCNNTARGSKLCAVCLCDQSGHHGGPLALVSAIRAVRVAENRLIEMMERKTT